MVKLETFLLPLTQKITVLTPRISIYYHLFKYFRLNNTTLCIRNATFLPSLPSEVFLPTPCYFYVTSITYYHFAISTTRVNSFCPTFFWGVEVIFKTIVWRGLEGFSILSRRVLIHHKGCFTSIIIKAILKFFF